MRFWGGPLSKRGQVSEILLPLAPISETSPLETGKEKLCACAPRGIRGAGGAFGRGFAGQRFSGSGHFHHRGFGRRLRFGPGYPGYYDYACSYRYPYNNRYRCHTPKY